MGVQFNNIENFKIYIDLFKQKSKCFKSQGKFKSQMLIKITTFFIMAHELFETGFIADIHIQYHYM